MDEIIVRDIAARVTLQAVKDYFHTSTKGKNIIIADLRSDWMRSLTNGTSKNVAEELEKHPEEIRKRMFKHAREGERL